MNRKFRLTSTKDFQRVRRIGRSYAHPFVVMIVGRNTQGRTRIGVTSSRGMSPAVVRNRAKRRLREALRPLVEQLASGWDIVFVARRPLLEANWEDLGTAVRSLIEQADLLES